MKKKLLILGCVCMMFLGQAQAKPMDCDGANALAVRLYKAGLVWMADAMFRALDERGCYDGGGL